LKTLASRIERQLQTGEWMHCAIYEDELKRFWPLNEKDREANITQFANEYGFRLRFYKKGLCAIFDKWPRFFPAKLGHTRDSSAGGSYREQWTFLSGTNG
jgi:hypothetical protein